MTFAGKIMVVAILIFCVMCMVLSVTVFVAQQNWPEQYRELQAENNNLQGQLQAATSKRDELDRDFQQATADLQESRAALQQQMDNWDNERQTLISGESEARTQLADFQQQAKEALEEAIFRRQEVIDLREKQLLAINERDQAIADRTVAEDQRIVAQQQLESAERRNKDLLTRSAKLMNLLVFYGIDPNQPDKPTVPPSVEGVVRRTSQTSDLIEISIGKDDGLAPQHYLHAFRPGRQPDQSQYLGQLEVLEVYPDRAIAKILRPSKGKIRKGDHVTSQLQ